MENPERPEDPEIVRLRQKLEDALKKVENFENKLSNCHQKLADEKKYTRKLEKDIYILKRTRTTYQQLKRRHENSSTKKPRGRPRIPWRMLGKSGKSNAVMRLINYLRKYYDEIEVREFLTRAAGRANHLDELETIELFQLMNLEYRRQRILRGYLRHRGRNIFASEWSCRKIMTNILSDFKVITDVVTFDEVDEKGKFTNKVTLNVLQVEDFKKVRQRLYYFIEHRI